MPRLMIEKNRKVYATCQYWFSLRDKNINFVIYDSEGQCMSARSFKKGEKVKGNQTCTFWSKWSNL